MSWGFCKITEPVAKKKHRCEATNTLTDLSIGDMEDVDKSVFKALMAQRYILPGERYLRASGIWEGEWTTLKSRHEADRLCRKYDLYDEY